MRRRAERFHRVSKIFLAAAAAGRNKLDKL